MVGVLIQEDGQYKVLAEGKAYRLLLASVTFYRAEVGDQVTILIPKSGTANWGAVDAIIPKHIAEASAKASVEDELDEKPKSKSRLSKSKKTEDGELSPKMDE